MGNALTKLLSNIREYIEAKNYIMDEQAIDVLADLEGIFEVNNIHNLDDLRVRLVRAKWWDSAVNSVSDFLTAVKEQI